MTVTTWMRYDQLGLLFIARCIGTAVYPMIDFIRWDWESTVMHWVELEEGLTEKKFAPLNYRLINF